MNAIHGVHSTGGLQPSNFVPDKIVESSTTHHFFSFSCTSKKCSVKATNGLKINVLAVG
jgi:hypothetical protein